MKPNFHSKSVEAHLNQQPPAVKAMTKLEKLLAQKDIFETLRRVNTGEIRSYHDLV